MTGSFVTVFERDDARVLLGERCVVTRFDLPQRILSFAPLRGGFRFAQSVAIVGVTNADLPIGRDPLDVLLSRSRFLDDDVVAMMTSRALNDVDVASAEHAEARAFAVATVGLSNAVRVGDSPGALRSWGTVNVIVHVDVPLTDEGMLELLTIVAEARTVAVLEADVESRRSASIASGTGTDCIAVCCPVGESPAVYAGKHTAIGHVVGACALSALQAGVARWRREVRP